MKKVNLNQMMNAYAEMKKMRSYLKKYENPDDRYGYNFQKWRFDNYTENLPRVEEVYNVAIGRLQTALNEVQYRRRVRTITVEDIIRKLLDVEDFLDMLSKKDMNHIKVICDLNGQRFPSAYKGVPESTIFEAEYVNGHWNINDVWRGKTRCTNEAEILGYSENAVKSIMRYYSKL